MNRLAKEIYLEFLTRVVFSFQTAEKPTVEKECAVVFFGKLPMRIQDKIMDVLGTDTTSFSNLVEFFKHRGK